MLTDLEPQTEKISEKSLTLEEYTEERFIRELKNIRGVDKDCIESSLSASRGYHCLVITNYNSSIVHGCISYCSKCDKLTVNSGPDSYTFNCLTCGKAGREQSVCYGNFYTKNDFLKIVDESFDIKSDEDLYTLNLLKEKIKNL